MILLGYITTFTYIFSVLFFVTMLEKYVHIKKETSRKMIHVLVSFSWFFIYGFFKNTWHALIPPSIFTILNSISYQKGTFAVMERSEQEKSPGTIFYAFSMVVLGLISLYHQEFLVCYGIGFFCMAFGDGLAPWFSRMIPSKSYGKKGKTVTGSVSVFILSFLVAMSFCYGIQIHTSIFCIMIIACCSTLLEAVGGKGIDNLTVPIGVAMISYLLLV